MEDRQLTTAQPERRSKISLEKIDRLSVVSFAMALPGK
jgi:hypothetical protein